MFASGLCPQVAGVLYAINPPVIAIILQAVVESFSERPKNQAPCHDWSGLGCFQRRRNCSTRCSGDCSGIAPADGYGSTARTRALFAVPLSGRLALLLGAPAAVAIVPVALLRLFLSFLEKSDRLCLEAIRVARVSQVGIHPSLALAYKKSN